MQPQGVPNKQHTSHSFIGRRCGGCWRNFALLAQGQNLFPMPSGILFHLYRPGSVGRQSESAEDGHFESVLVHQVVLVVTLALPMLPKPPPSVWQFVMIAPEVLAKVENRFVDTRGIVLGTVEMTTLLTAASGLLRKLEMDTNAEA